MPPRQAVQLVPFQWIADTFRDGQIAFEIYARIKTVAVPRRSLAGMR